VLRETSACVTADAMRALYQELATEMEASSGQAALIIDDLATFGWNGIDMLELSRFSRAICALARTVMLLLSLS
jgi:hypothetical protein